MPTRPCPECQTPNPRRLDFVNSYLHVDVYLCLACGHAWHTPKGTPDGPIADVTVDRLDRPTDDA